MGTDWFVKVKCPKPSRVKDEQQHIEVCSSCPYVIWKKPKPVAGFMASMCGVRVGSIWMAAELDDIGEKLTGRVRFTKTDGKPEEKLLILEKIREHINNGWRLEGFTKEDMLEWIDELIEFCRRCQKKGLEIRSWA